MAMSPATVDRGFSALSVDVTARLVDVRAQTTAQITRRCAQSRQDLETTEEAAAGHPGTRTRGPYRCPSRSAEDQQLFVVRDLTLDLCESDLLPAIATPRSLDLAHLRTAL
jgi:hypothetical protein